jgi:hypothetical protein
MDTSSDMPHTTDYDTTEIGWRNKAIERLAAAVLERAMLDYKNGTPDMRMDAYQFLIEEDCGIWRDFLSLLPGWNKDIKRPAPTITREQKDKAVEMYRTCTLTLRQVADILDTSYLAVRSAVAKAIPAESREEIERKLLEYRRYWSLHDRLSGVSCHDTGIRRHASAERVTKWMKELLTEHGVEDTTKFLMEMNKKGQGTVHDKCQEMLRELEKNGIPWDRH